MAERRAKRAADSASRLAELPARLAAARKRFDDLRRETDRARAVLGGLTAYAKNWAGVGGLHAISKQHEDNDVNGSPR